MKTLLLPRAVEDAADSAALWRAAGVTHVISTPVMTLRGHEEPPPLASPDGVMITSRHAPRFKPATLLPSAWRAAPLVVVGARTAAVAHAQGYSSPLHIAVDGAALAAWMLDAGLRGCWGHLSGVTRASEPTASLEAAGLVIAPWRVYEAVAMMALAAEARRALVSDSVDGIAFYSPRQAALWTAVIQAEGLQACCSRLDALCLSQAVATAARALAWRRVVTAAAPTEEALLATLDAL